MTHGGHGTAMRALRNGVPMVVIPGLAGDQPFVAAAVQEWGVGRALPGDADAAAMRAAAQEVLATPSFRLNAEARARRSPASTARATPRARSKRCWCPRRRVARPERFASKMVRAHDAYPRAKSEIALPSALLPYLCAQYRARCELAHRRCIGGNVEKLASSVNILRWRCRHAPFRLSRFVAAPRFYYFPAFRLLCRPRKTAWRW